MKRLDYDALQQFVSEEVVAPFYIKRTRKLRVLQLKRDILTHKNPYLFKAKNVKTSEEFVRHALNAFLSSQEETIFGNLLENLAIHICSEVFGGKKAPQKVLKSIDLLFERDENYYIVSIKSSFNWGNADQIGRMKTNFKAAKALLRNNGEARPIIAVNGCMYGTDNSPYKPDPTDPEMSYYKYCGEVFWEFISGDSHLYLDLIQPLEAEASKRSLEFDDLYFRKLNEMAAEFGSEYLTEGQIDWEKLVRFVSAKAGPSPQIPLIY